MNTERALPTGCASWALPRFCRERKKAEKEEAKRKAAEEEEARKAAEQEALRYEGWGLAGQAHRANEPSDLCLMLSHALYRVGLELTAVVPLYAPTLRAAEEEARRVAEEAKRAREAAKAELKQLRKKLRAVAEGTGAR